MKNARSSRSKDAELHQEGAIITIDSLPEHLRTEFDQTVTQYHEQVDLLNLEPNHVQYKVALNKAAEKMQGLIEDLKQIKNLNVNDKRFSIVDDNSTEYGLVISDDDTPAAQCDCVPDIMPGQFFDKLIEAAEGQLSRVRQELTNLPTRTGGKKEDRAVKLYYSQIIPIFQRAGGTIPKPLGDTEHRLHDSPLKVFMKEAAKQIGYVPQSDQSLLVLARYSIRKSRHNSY